MKNFLEWLQTDTKTGAKTISMVGIKILMLAFAISTLGLTAGMISLFFGHTFNVAGVMSIWGGITGVMTSWIYGRKVFNLKLPQSAEDIPPETEIEVGRGRRVAKKTRGARGRA